MTLRSNKHPCVTLALIASMPRVFEAVQDKCITKANCKKDSKSFYVSNWICAVSVGSFVLRKRGILRMFLCKKDLLQNSSLPLKTTGIKSIKLRSLKCKLEFYLEINTTRFKNYIFCINFIHWYVTSVFPDYTYLF